MDDPFSILLRNLATTGPVGVFVTIIVLGGFYVWLRYRQIEVPEHRETVSIDAGRLALWHQENRDHIRDTKNTVEEIARVQEREIEYLSNMTAALVRVADALDRIDRRRS